jgi:hypothetical protein
LNDSYKKGGSDEFPTTAKFLASMKNSLKTSGGYTITDTAPTSGLAYKGSFGKFLSDNCYQKTKKKVPGGVYVFDDDKCDPASQGNTHSDLSNMYEPYIMCLDGSDTYHFWFKGNKTYNPRMVVFVVYNQDLAKYKGANAEENPVLFLLEDNAKIYWPGKGGDTDSDGTKVGNNGILSVQGRNLTSATAAYNLVNNLYSKNGAQGPQDFENTGGKGYSVNYNGKNKPWAMIIGMGHNTVKFDQYIIVEAFIGLYNKDYKTGKQSHLIFRNGNSGVMYGRIMTDDYADFDGGGIKAPAAPGSSSFSGGKKTIRKLVTGFSLDKMIYYYGT